MTKTKPQIKHDVSVVNLGQLFFWKCSCGASAGQGAASSQMAQRMSRHHRAGR